MPPPMISSTRLVRAARRRASGRAATWSTAGRLVGEPLGAGRLGGRAQDGAHLVLDRAAVPGRAQAELLLELFVELADGE